MVRVTPTDGPLRRVGLAPLVRPTRNEAEVTLLPPYGDPEVSLTGELGTYLLVGGVAALGYVLFRRRREAD